MWDGMGRKWKTNKTKPGPVIMLGKGKKKKPQKTNKTKGRIMVLYYLFNKHVFVKRLQRKLAYLWKV